MVLYYSIKGDVTVENIGNVRFMQKINRERVLSFIRKNSPVSRNELSKVTGLSLSSITNIVNHLMDLNLVAETGRIRAEGAGRKAVSIEFNPSAMKLLAVNIETDGAEVALTDLSGGILESKSVEIARGASAKDVLEAMSGIILKLASERGNVKAIGLAVSGHVDDDGAVSSSIMHWERENIGADIGKLTGLPVCIENNTKTKCLWTLRALNDCEHENTVFLDMSSDGIGIAAASAGEINKNVSGELGHTLVSIGEGLYRLEELCATSRMSRIYEELTGTKLSPENVYKKACSGDASAKHAVDSVCMYFSAAITNIIMVFEPDLIIVNASGFADMPGLYGDAVKSSVEYVSKLSMKIPDFRQVNIRSNQSAQGAAQAAADMLLGLDGPDDIL